MVLATGLKAAAARFLLRSTYLYNYSVLAFASRSLVKDQLVESGSSRGPFSQAAGCEAVVCGLPWPREMSPKTNKTMGDDFYRNYQRENTKCSNRH